MHLNKCTRQLKKLEEIQVIPSEANEKKSESSDDVTDVDFEEVKEDK